jgi:hypothetical protein
MVGIAHYWTDGGHCPPYWTRPLGTLIDDVYDG